MFAKIADGITLSGILFCSCILVLQIIPEITHFGPLKHAKVMQPKTCMHLRTNLTHQSGSAWLATSRRGHRAHGADGGGTGAAF